MRKVRPLGQVKATRKSSMPAASYTTVRDLQDDELLSPNRLKLPYRKTSEPLPPSTILMGRQMTSLGSNPTPVSESRSETRTDIRTDDRLSPLCRYPTTLLSRRRTSEPAALSVFRPPPSISPSILAVSSSSLPHSPQVATPPPPPSPPPPPRLPVMSVEVQAMIFPNPGLIQRRHDFEVEIQILLANQTELENNAKSCGFQGEEYKRLYEAELAAHERSKMNQNVIEERLEEMVSRRQRLLAEHEAAVSSTRREFTLRTDITRREHSLNLSSFNKKLLTLGACIPTKTTAVNERQNQLSLLLRDKQALLDELDYLRDRVGKIKVSEEDDDEEEKKHMPCRSCENKTQTLEGLKEECARKEERIAELQERIRVVEGNINAINKRARHHQSASSVGQRRG